MHWTEFLSQAIIADIVRSVAVRRWQASVRRDVPSWRPRSHGDDARRGCEFQERWSLWSLPPRLVPSPWRPTGARRGTGKLRTRHTWPCRGRRPGRLEVGETAVQSEGDGGHDMQLSRCTELLRRILTDGPDARKPQLPSRLPVNPK